MEFKDSIIFSLSTDTKESFEGDIVQNYIFIVDEWCKDSLYLSPGHFTEDENNGPTQKSIHQHLYFTTNEKIVKGDWVYYKDGFDSSLFKATKVEGDRVFDGITAFPDTYTKKIVVSTDKSLELPAPPKEALKIYCDMGGEINQAKVAIVNNQVIIKIGE
jgi:hypothetical protein